MIVKRGFTILEIVLAFGIIMLMSGVVLISYPKYKNRANVSAVSAKILSLLADARARTLDSDGDSAYGVHFATSSATLFMGNSYSFSTTTEIYNTFSGVLISPINLKQLGSASNTDIVFQRLTGASMATGTLRVVASTSPDTKYDIIIEESGVFYKQ